jgi:hypothetical protein
MDCIARLIAAARHEVHKIYYAMYFFFRNIYMREINVIEKYCGSMCLCKAIKRAATVMQATLFLQQPGVRNET